MLDRNVIFDDTCYDNRKNRYQLSYGNAGARPKATRVKWYSNHSKGTIPDMYGIARSGRNNDMLRIAYRIGVMSISLNLINTDTVRVTMNFRDL